MALWINDNAVTIGADGTALIADAASPHGVKFGTPSGGAGGMTQIAQVVTSSSQATVVFSSIPGTYSNLYVTALGRDTKTTVAGAFLRLYFNADQTAANYSSAVVVGEGTGLSVVTTVASTTNGGAAGLIPGTLSVATAYGTNDITILGYANTTFYKSSMGKAWQRTTATTGLAYETYGFDWQSTAAITSMTFTAGGTAFVDGSTFTLYGLA